MFNFNKERFQLAENLRSALCSSECDKITSLLVFYVNEKFTHQVIYFNIKSSIVLCQGENLHIKFITLLLVANFFLRKYIFVDQVSCFDIKFLIFVWNAIFPLPSQLPRRNKKYMSSLYFHKSRRPGDDPVKRAQVVWKLKKTENSNCNNNCLSMFISCSTSYLISSWQGHVFIRR